MPKTDLAFEAEIFSFSPIFCNKRDWNILLLNVKRATFVLCSDCDYPLLSILISIQERDLFFYK